MQKKEKLKEPDKTEWFNKPYNFFGDYLRSKYNHRVMKVPINSDLGCPNRDGTVGSQGCIFCSEDGSASRSSAISRDIKEQMLNGIKNFDRSDENTGYIAYFQAFTNTYSSVVNLKEIYDRALSIENTMGLMIGTRPDCIDKDIVDLISSYDKENFELWIELGMQTSHDSSLKFLQRGHNNQTTLKAIELISEKNISLCLHIILGIPGENWGDMMATARLVSTLPISGVKLHHLHVIKNTPLEKVYNRKKFQLISFQEYISTACDFMERLRPDIIIHRLAGEKDSENLVAPAWSLHKGTIQNAIEDEFKRRQTYQGFLYDPEVDFKIV